MPVQAYSRQNPRYRRLYKTHELRRQGFRKLKDEWVNGEKVLVYVRRRYGPAGPVTIKEARVFPDGSCAMTEFD